MYAVFGVGYASVLLAMLAILIAVTIPFFGKTKSRITSNYMCGVNNGDNSSYAGSMGTDVNISMRNWYLEGWFGEGNINRMGLVLTIVILVVCFVMVIGSVNI